MSAGPARRSSVSRDTPKCSAQPISNLSGAFVLLAASTSRPAVVDGHDRPNVIIVADDLGFSDLGSYGGEIATPRLDRLAEEGLRFTDFYVAPTCSPTRSMLPTGRDNRTVGLGNSFLLLNGAGSHFDFTGSNRENERSEFVEGGTCLTRLPRGYYSTKTFTDKIIEYVDDGRAVEYMDRELGRRLETIDDDGEERAAEPEDTTYVSVSVELMR